MYLFNMTLSCIFSFWYGLNNVVNVFFWLGPCYLTPVTWLANQRNATRHLQSTMICPIYVFYFSRLMIDHWSLVISDDRS